MIHVSSASYFETTYGSTQIAFTSKIVSRARSNDLVSLEDSANAAVEAGFVEPHGVRSIPDGRAARLLPRPERRLEVRGTERVDALTVGDSARY